MKLLEGKGKPKRFSGSPAAIKDYLQYGQSQWPQKLHKSSTFVSSQYLSIMLCKTILPLSREQHDYTKIHASELLLKKILLTGDILSTALLQNAACIQERFPAF